VDLKIDLPDTLDLGHQHIVALRTGAAPGWIAYPRRVATVARRGDLQYPADRLDPVGRAMRIDEIV
ncbi:MAG: hypothetical protein QG662_1278, partial [Pseudomonadota bacterium]|nr:hypothetical protein [Pseudomonadota bacterium]